MRRLLSGQEAEVIAAYQAGATIEELAANLDCSARPVRRVLLDAGVALRRKGRPYPYDERTERRLAKAYADGATIDQLEADFGGTNRTVRRAIVRQGGVIRPTGRRRG